MKNKILLGKNNSFRFKIRLLVREQCGQVDISVVGPKYCCKAPAKER